MPRESLFRFVRACVAFAAALGALFWIGPVFAQTQCGSDGQRACCVGEASFGACRTGTSEVPKPNSGLCGGPNPFRIQASGMCVADTPCGGDGQRACCAGEASSACSGGLQEIPRPNSGQCSKSLPGVQSSGICVAVSPCGGEGQRACCAGEASSACAGNLQEIPRPNSGQCGRSLPGVQSSGICVAVSPCGGEGQRACCAGEASRACSGNLQEIPRPNSGQCGRSLPGVQSSGICVAVSPCGGEGQRACCAGEASSACSGALQEIPQPNSGQCGRSLPGVQSSGICVAVTPCGGEGQRACCAGEESFGFCRSGLLREWAPNSGQCARSLPGVQSSHRCVHPPCGRAFEKACTVDVRVPSCDDGLLEEHGHCLPATPCGGRGERACSIVDRLRTGADACRPGLTEVPGCNGACFQSSGTCVDFREELAEPSTNSSGHPAPGSMRGYADTHVHMFSFMAFGGGVFAGKPYDAEGGIAAALRPDFATDLDIVTIFGTRQPANACPPNIPNCGKYILHGDHIINDDPAGIVNGDAPKSNFGAPAFVSWPHWSSTTHQQTYYKWMERAWRGGLRLMTMLAVNNEVLCRTSKHIKGVDCGDAMASIDAQIEATKEFETWVNAQPGGDWFKIVYSADEAETAIREGKLAVVLGIEVDSLFNCKLGRGCTPQSVDADLDRYFEMGVRHIYPTHNFDNEFGGTAVWMNFLNFGNRIISNAWYGVESCPNTDFFLATLGQVGTTILNLLGGALDSGAMSEYPNYPQSPSCNVKGLSPLGEHLIDGMMDRGMLIDIDHMSSRSIDGTLTLAEKRPGYPLMAGHVLFSSLHKSGANRHERMRTRAQLDRMRALGSVISVMTQDEIDTETTYVRGAVEDAPRRALERLREPRILRAPRERGPVVGELQTAPAAAPKTYVNSCVHSSRSFAQTYLYAIDVMAGPVAFGSDFNGVARHVGPRFGVDGCFRNAVDGQWIREQQTARLGYPFVLPGFGVFDRQVTGQRTFDFNTDGLAHIGLLPDLIADMRVVGVTEQELEPLMNSAGAYVAAWKKAESLRGK